MFIEVLLLAVLVYLVYRPLKKNYEYFNDSGVPYAPAGLILGSFWRSAFKKLSLIDDLKRVYNDVGDERTRFIGGYNFLTPLVLLKDPELIKQITIKDFDSFSEHRMTINEDIEPLFGKNLVALRGQKWRDMRMTLSPAFTSSKIREMCPFIAVCGQQMNDYLRQKCMENTVDGVPQFEADLRDVSTRFMNDVIANIAFGFNVDSFKDPDNEFFTFGKKLTNIGLFQFLKMMFTITFPKAGKWLGLRMFSEEINHFFRNQVLNNMKYRRDNKIIRKDMIHLLMEAKEGSISQENSVAEKDAGFATVEESNLGTNNTKRVWSDDDLVAQAMLFFFGGFDSSSNLTSFVLHELTLNQDVQNKLYEEVNENVKKHGQELTYEMLQKMDYLDMVISETLRKWPPGFVNDRSCVKDCNIGPIKYDGDKTYTVKKGVSIWTPVHAIHHDPKYWPNPDKFDPERFSDENKDNIKPWTYLPFGAGPRNCIGSRFALAETKMMIYYLISKFSFYVSPKTNLSGELDTTAFNLKMKGGFWANIKMRDLKK